MYIIWRIMSNPVEKIRAFQSTAKLNDLTFPSTLGNDEERHFTYILVKELATGANQPTLKGTIALPMPLEIVDDYKVEYADAQLGPLGATAVGVGSSIATEVSVDNIKKSLTSGLGSFNSGLLGQVIAKKAIEFIPGISTGDGRAAARQIVTSATNKAINPYITGVFKSVGFKTFNFSFRCHPRNSQDSQNLTQIIKFFRDSMLPEDDMIEVYDDSGDELEYLQQSGLQTLPHRFDINFFSDNSDAGFSNESQQLFGSRHLPKVSNAAMTSFAVDYETEGGPSFHKNSSPVTTVLNMTFIESKIYTRENVKQENDLYGITEKL